MGEHTPGENATKTFLWGEVERLAHTVDDLRAALKLIAVICREDNAATRRRMGTKVGNCLVVAEDALAKARGQS